jgi:hypothetical protein
MLHLAKQPIAAMSAITGVSAQANPRLGAGFVLSEGLRVWLRFPVQVIRSRQKHPVRSGESALKIRGWWFQMDGIIRLI